jgi:hypothetical protein
MTTEELELEKDDCDVQSLVVGVPLLPAAEVT